MHQSHSRLPKRRFLAGTISKALTIGLLSATLPMLVEIQPSAAQTCNAFGCSQPGAGACNPFGCPNPGAAPCTPFGCPASPQNSNAPAPQVVPVPVPVPQPYPAPGYPPQPYPYPPQGTYQGGSAQGITSCMKNLMYEQKLVCTRSYCSQLRQEAGYGGWQLQTVRTEISEAAAVQACQNAR